jgi:hypothetical protein
VGEHRGEAQQVELAPGLALERCERTRLARELRVDRGLELGRAVRIARAQRRDQPAA